MSLGLIQVAQTPLPPLPPLPPMGSGVPEEVFFLTALFLVVAGIILFPLARAFARRLEGKGTADLRGEIEGLHQRVGELEVLEQRLAELENRIEFSERLLTQQRESLPERGARS